MTTRTTEAAIKRALAAAVAAGLAVQRFSVARDGTVTVETVAKAAEDVPRKEPKAWRR